MMWKWRQQLEFGLLFEINCCGIVLNIILTYILLKPLYTLVCIVPINFKSENHCLSNLILLEKKLIGVQNQYLILKNCKFHYNLWKVERCFVKTSRHAICLFQQILLKLIIHFLMQYQNLRKTDIRKRKKNSSWVKNNVKSITLSKNLRYANTKKMQQHTINKLSRSYPCTESYLSKAKSLKNIYILVEVLPLNHLRF